MTGRPHRAPGNRGGCGGAALSIPRPRGSHFSFLCFPSPFSLTSLGLTTPFVSLSLNLTLSATNWGFSACGAQHPANTAHTNRRSWTIYHTSKQKTHPPCPHKRTAHPRHPPCALVLVKAEFEPSSTLTRNRLGFLDSWLGFAEPSSALTRFGSPDRYATAY